MRLLTVVLTALAAKAQAFCAEVKKLVSETDAEVERITAAAEAEAQKLKDALVAKIASL